MQAAARAVVIGFVVTVPVVCWAVEAGVALTASHLTGLALVAVAAVAWWRERRALSRDLAVVSLLAFCVVAAITVVRVHVEPSEAVGRDTTHAKSIKQLIGLGFGAAVFLALLHLVTWYRLGRAVVRAHVWAAVVIACLALAQYVVALIDLSSPFAAFPVHNSTLGATRQLTLQYGFPRVAATLVEPSRLGTYLLTAWVFWLAAFTPAIERPGQRWWRAIIPGAILGAAIVTTGSRLAYVILAVVALAAVASLPHRRLRATLVAASIAAGLAVTGPAAAARIADSLVRGLQRNATNAAPAAHTSDQPFVGIVGRYDMSVEQRSASYVVAMTAVRHRPFLGHGWGTADVAMERYWPDTAPALPAWRTMAPAMMTAYGTIATETGLAGLGCVALFALVLASRLRQRWREGATEDRAAVAGAAAMTMVYALAMLSSTLVVYQFLLGWLVAVAALSAGPPSKDVVPVRSAAPARVRAGS